MDCAIGRPFADLEWAAKRVGEGKKGYRVGFHEGRGRRSPANQHERKQKHREDSMTCLDDNGHVGLKIEKKATWPVLSRLSRGLGLAVHR